MITVKHIREKYGKQSKDSTDKELQAIIDFLYSVCERVISIVTQNKTKS